MRVLLLAVVALALGTGTATAGTPAQNLAWLNAKRAAHGIPAGIALDDDWSAKCRQHIDYLSLTNTMSHGEDPANPHYTEAGNWAGNHAVLSVGATWTADRFIWEHAPFHLAQLLAPQLTRTGAADALGYTCMTTWPGYTRTPPALDRVVTYPGNGATIYASMTAAEEPSTPAEALGLANPTGPHLYAYIWGPTLGRSDEPAVSSATVVGPQGPVEVRWIDRSTPDVGLYLPQAAAILIPVRPLAANADYTATVIFDNGVRRSWSFATGVPRDRRLRGVALRIARRSATTAVVRVTGRLTAGFGRPVARARLGVRIGRTERGAVRTGDDGGFDVSFVVRASDLPDVIVTVHGAAAAPRTYTARLR